MKTCRHRGAPLVRRENEPKGNFERRVCCTKHCADQLRKATFHMTPAVLPKGVTASRAHEFERAYSLRALPGRR